MLYAAKCYRTGVTQWLVTTLPQERYYTSIAVAGFVCLAATAVFARNLLGRDRALARTGALATGAGALLWITGSVAELGGHRAVGLMATHAHPIQTTNSIAFTIDTITATFSLVGFAMIGAGSSRSPRPQPYGAHGTANGPPAWPLSRLCYWPPPDPTAPATTSQT